MKMRKVVERAKVDFIRFFVQDEETATQLLNTLAISKNVRAVDTVIVGEYVTLLGPDSKTLHTFVDFVKLS